jgi:hypothetical protein
MLAPIALETERNHIRKSVSSGEKFNSLLAVIPSMMPLGVVGYGLRVGLQRLLAALVHPVDLGRRRTSCARQRPANPVILKDDPRTSREPAPPADPMQWT